MFIPDLGVRGQKSTGSRIRNTTYLFEQRNRFFFSAVFFFMLNLTSKFRRLIRKNPTSQGLILRSGENLWVRKNTETIFNLLSKKIKKRTYLTSSELFPTPESPMINSLNK